ncbi:hypothetical protein BCV69DRAFT_312630 [Microstroma glucosiphilum]|uniref:Uncharacterized protein n=1 Tax=Pseudomicrostroma glucosiphilum TaxID=1684307 RepID=A0A316U774_9BASI|nr:hypothetical protein BCV69DRAFT_312630 [Pseudomicrostroma glucosiphilum]PWN20678.1 hypothetical protein BCV69DRAFT_312630 [Pseudomicrostroma glucosiphilum]
MTSGQGLGSTNPWAEEPPASRYDEDLASILESQSQIADGSEKSLQTRSAEATALTDDPAPSSEPSSRPDFLNGDDYEGSRPGTASSGTYSAKLRSILGSEGADETAETPDPSGQNELRATGAVSIPDVANMTMDSHADTTFELPDNSMRSIPHAPDNARFRYRPGFHKGRDPSLSFSISSSQHSGFEAPRRPAEYPSLSRLRASGILRPISSPSSKAADRFRFPFGSMSSISTAHRNTLEAGSSAPNSVSRATSISSSMSAQRNRIFPYGANDIEASSDFSIDSSIQRHRADVHHGGKIAQTDLTEMGIADRGIFKWSALRKVAAYFQDGGKRPKEVPIPESNQTLPQVTGDKTLFVVGGSLLAVGTTEGYTLVFEFAQNFKCICGSPSLGRTGGQVTSLAFSADNSFLAVGHAKGHVALYDLAKPSSPARQVPPVMASEVAAGRREGHLIGSRVLQVAFVGARHTAIFTADENGLSFYHSLGKILGVASNDTLRILGRYPEYMPPHEGQADGITARHRRKRSPPILALTPLPLGPVDHPSDVVHFVALMTTQKLVVVGLSPSARTWYRKSAPRPSAAEKPRFVTEAASATLADAVEGDELQGLEGPAEAPTLNHILSPSLSDETKQRDDHHRTACASWFPAFQADEVSSCTDASGFVQPRLAFAFDRQVYLLDLDAREAVATDNSHDNSRTNGSNAQQQRKTELHFSERLIWTEPTEVVEAIQWLSHELLLLLTPTSLKLLDMRVGRVTERESLEPTLRSLVRMSSTSVDKEGQPAGNAPSSSTFVAPSVRVHKGRAFFLTRPQIVVGQLITWGERLLGLVSTGDFLSAIDLATQYYEGTVPGSFIGLPQDPALLKEQVGSKLRELMSASARYTFSPDRLTDTTHVTADGRGVDRTELFVSLTRTCAHACLAMGDMNFLFDDLYDLFSDNGIESIFVEQMVDFILAGRMRQLPLPVTQRLISSCQREEKWDVAEKIIWHVDPLCLDLDQVLKMCAKQKLYDAMIYVFNTALKDFVSPVVELLGPLKDYLRARAISGMTNGWGDESHDAADAEEYNMEPAASSEGYKIMSYMSVILSGRSYPAQQVLEESLSQQAKSSLYDFIFSGHCIVWPPGGGGKLVLSVDESETEPAYPYLLLLLRFDAEAFLDALDIAFEDAFLDEDLDEGQQRTNNLQSQVTRQTVVEILLEVSASLAESDVIFTTIFISRNAPKYPQFIRLSASTVSTLLVSLSRTGDESTRDDRQLAAESLLSAYRHSFTDEDLDMFEQAGFWRILQSAYKAAGKWEKLTTMLLSDPDLGEGVFGRLTEVLTKAKSRTQSSKTELASMIVHAVPHLMPYSAAQVAQLIDRFYPDKHAQVLDELEADEESQFEYLRVFVDPHDSEHHGEEGLHPAARRPDKNHLDADARELFIALQSRFDASALLRVLDEHQKDPGYFDLETVVEVARRNSAYDAILWALDRQDQPAKAFDALDETIATVALKMRKASEGSYQVQEMAAQLRRATNMAVRICSERCEPASLRVHTAFKVDEMWYRLLRSLVSLIHAVATPGEISSESSAASSPALQLSRDIVQDTLSAMVTSMSAATVSFPHLFRRLVDAEPAANDGGSAGAGQTVRYYAEVKTVVEGMLTACRLRTDLLSITNRIFDRDTFSSLAQLTRQSKRGWRPAYEDGHISQALGSTRGAGGPGAASTPTTPARRRPRRTSSTSTAATATATGPASGTRKTPTRGIDFLSSASASSFDSASYLPLQASASPSSLPSPSPLTPRLDKGKGRERPIEEVRREDEFGGVEEDHHGGGSGSVQGGDYFSSPLTSQGEDVAGSGPDPSEGFLSTPFAALYDEVPIPLPAQESAMAGERMMTLGGGAGGGRGPVRVRLGVAR